MIRLTPAEWRKVATAYGYLLVAGWRLFILRQRVDTWLGKEFPDGNSLFPTELKHQTAVQTARWVHIAARHPFQWARCLQRSLALYLWLSRQDLQADLRIGVRKVGKAIEAHAWVEYGGEVLADDPNVSALFVPMIGSSAGQDKIARWK